MMKRIKYELNPPERLMLLLDLIGDLYYLDRKELEAHIVQYDGREEYQMRWEIRQLLNSGFMRRSDYLDGFHVCPTLASGYCDMPDCACVLGSLDLSAPLRGTVSLPGHLGPSHVRNTK